MGEKLDALEEFHPERMRSGILGMGDAVGLVGKAAETIDRAEAEKLAAKMQKGSFDLEDFASQLKQLKKMGGMSGVMGMLPGIGKVKKQLADAKIDESILKKQEAIILSMTPRARHDWPLLGAKRKQRVANGSGATLVHVHPPLQHLYGNSRLMEQGPA